MRKRHFLWAILLSTLAISLSYWASLATNIIITVSLIGYACIAFTFSITEWFCVYTQRGAMDDDL